MFSRMALLTDTSLNTFYMRRPIIRTTFCLIYSYMMTEGVTSIKLSNLSLAPGQYYDWRGYINGPILILSYWAHTGYVRLNFTFACIDEMKKKFFLGDKIRNLGKIQIDPTNFFAPPPLFKNRNQLLYFQRYTKRKIVKMQAHRTCNVLQVSIKVVIGLLNIVNLQL